MKRPVRIAAVLIGLLYVSVAAAQKANPSVQERLSAAVGPAIAAHRGVVSVYFEHPATGAVYKHDADRPMPSASLIKFPVMLAAYEAAATRKLDLDKPVTLREDDKVPGSGILTNHFSAGVSMPVRDAIRLMIVYSDNTATNLVIDQIGIDAVNALMDRLGCPGTRLNSKVFRRDTSVAMARSQKYGLGVMNAAETASLYKRLLAGDPFGADRGGPKASDEACREMMGHLRACEATNMVPRYLPEGTTTAHKTGAVAETRCDGGIIESSVGPIVYCVMTTDNEDQSWGDDNEAFLLGAEIGKAALAAFSTTDGAVEAPAVARVLRMGADGPMVEALQRTLASKLPPEEACGVDGDFGPNTQRAVQRFQKRAGLEPTGEVDSKTWLALGPLVTEGAQVPSPVEVAEQRATPKIDESLTGPPLTTCPAWAIVDGATGELLWGLNDSVSREPASTTKMMTALLVAEFADADPKALDELITFTKEADNTSGSTADVRVGEQVAAGELLYGLMLPSGNDASVAFAEHFGKRFPAINGQPDATPFDRFIAAMNARAKLLGMNDTAYKNPHGLPAAGHVTTAFDLTKLARAVAANPHLAPVVATRRRGATLGSVDGHQRNVVWNNSNQLLGINGYTGVKTGTTDAAGACLASKGERGGRSLVVVVLGSTSGDARFVDSRNLYRWAWNQLGVK
jgi:D-alanyl-D-alanine carboxypeptidase (penicillin-binding protein 5/6)